MPSEKRIAYLGPKGSFTHQAALKAFPTSEGHTHEPQKDFLAVFSIVQAGDVDRGVVPIENSTNGFVHGILDLFADPSNKFPQISITGETFVPVQQALLGRKPAPPTLDGTIYPESVIESSSSLSRIKLLYSHPQAWGQCTPFLTEHLRNAERIDTTSTSKAAEIVAGDRTGISAAICSPLAAEIYGLDVLESNIAEKKDNMTRFLVLQKRTEEGSNGSPPRSRDEGASWRSLISFTIPHTQPASLANALAVFGKHNINLTSLNSRPNGDRRWNYIFFVEFWGKRDDQEVDQALNEMGKVVENWKWLGSWVSSQADAG